MPAWAPEQLETVVQTEPHNVVGALEADIEERVAHGGRLIQSFLRAGLIADITITHIPILLGAGRSLFGALPQDVGLTHIETTSYPSGFVQSHYVVGRMG
ncbi:MAG: dihydrofolate reductase family protein [Mesorhizobium sp.]|nr:dihydrofolate reductase family protein [Mesorhizobium sp.]